MQRKKLKDWINTTRYVYNKTVNSIKSGEKVNFYALRNKLVTAKNNNLPDWELKTPKDVRAGAIRDLVKGFKIAMSNLKKRKISRFSLRYRSKRNDYSIEIPKSAIKYNNKSFRIYSRFIKTSIRSSNDKKYLADLTIDHDCRLKYQGGQWYLFIPYKCKKRMKAPTKEICALDPGIRKFQTLYSENETVKIEVNKEVLRKFYIRLDKLRSLRSKKRISRSSFKKKYNKAQHKMNNLVDDVHYKTISYLTSTYKTIFLPSFENQEIAKIIKRRTTKRNLFNLKHYRFKQRLLENVSKHFNVIICSEEYTSKTCGRCGTLNNVRSREIFNCSKCSLKIDRDVNGARNIFLKNLIR